MFGLGEDAGPCLEEGTGVGDGVGEGLEFVIEYVGSVVLCRDLGGWGVVHTSMFPDAFSKLSTTPSTTWLMVRIPASSLRSAASRASSVSYFDSVGGAFLRMLDEGVFGRSDVEFLGLRGLGFPAAEGDANRSSVSERSRLSICELMPLEAMIILNATRCNLLRNPRRGSPLSEAFSM